MWSTARTIADRDVVIVWMTRDLVRPLVIESGKEFNSKFGVYRHSDLIGVPYGSKIGSRNGKGFIHILRPTPELWTLALPHRTQILYLADIAFIVSWLNIKPGSRVIEAGMPHSTYFTPCLPIVRSFLLSAGTGSGSFSHSVARTIGPRGHLWSYEFHEARVSKAREEFTRHGIENIVTLTHRNVCKEGFTVENTVDAVFLDLPAPWDAVEHAKKALRRDCITRICCFSPCMEQVLRTVNALNDSGFTEITMYETLVRPHQVDAVPALSPISEISTKLKKAEQRREEKRLRQIANSRAARQSAFEGKRKRDAQGSEGPVEKKRKTEEENTHEPRTSDDEQAEVSSTSITKQEAETELAGIKEEDLALSTVHVEDVSPDLEEDQPTKISLSKAFPEVRGHTSYLTFACLLPAFVSDAPSLIEEQPIVSSLDAAGPSEVSLLPVCETSD